MTHGVTVSVVVATRNRAQYLGDSLDALAAQRCRSSFEVVVVDNGSTDDTPALIERYCRGDSRFVAEPEPGLGQSRAKNAGVRRARGGILLFSDDDVVVGPHWIAAYEDFFASSPADLLLVGGPVLPVAHDLADWPEWLRGGLVEFMLPEYGGERALAEFEYVWGANMAVPARLFARIGPWNESVGHRGDERGTFEDVDYQNRVRAAGYPVWFCPAAPVRHRVDRGSITPRHVLSCAFARGSYEFWMEVMRTSGDRDHAPKRSLVAGVLRLSCDLISSAAWTLALRLAPVGWVFERARRRTRSSGYSLDSLQPGREGMRFYRLLRRTVFRVRNLSLRLAPDEA